MYYNYSNVQLVIHIYIYIYMGHVVKSIYIYIYIIFGRRGGPSTIIVHPPCFAATLALTNISLHVIQYNLQ